MSFCEVGTANGCMNSNVPSVFCRLDLIVLLHFVLISGWVVHLLHVRNGAHAEPLHTDIQG